MIIPTITNVIPVSAKALKISWIFPVTVEDVREYSFELQRSENNENGFESIHLFNHDEYYVDTDAPLIKIWKNLYYRIKVINNSNNEIAYSKIAPLSALPDMQALEIVRRNDILLKNRRYGTGSPVAVFKLKTWGPKCLECWDSLKQKVRSSSCSSCFKTGIEGGYYDPIITWANLTPPHKAITIPQWGEMEPNEIRIFMNNEPAVNPKDLIYVPSQMMFYQVEQIETTTRREFILHQVVAAVGIERNNVVYKLLDKYPDLLDTLNKERTKIRLK